jgi:chemotaxis protein MotB
MKITMSSWGSRLLLLASCAALPVLGGCVSQGRYDKAVAQADVTRAELTRKNALLERSSVERAAMQGELAARHDELSARVAETVKLKSELDALQAQASGQTTESRTRIAELQKRLGELQSLQRAAESRAAAYRDLTFRLKKQIDDGELAIVLRDGRMVLQLPNDVLFDTGRTELKPAGGKALAAVAEVIRTMPHRQFQVAGHTDNVPIHNERFPSNWELSAGRALRVVHFLIEKGVDAPSLSAAGYSEIDPVAKNETPDGRMRNRRTEITLQPNIDEIVKLP